MVLVVSFFFLMIRRPPSATLDRSSAASDVYKRQAPVTLAPNEQRDVRLKISPKTSGPLSGTVTFFASSGNRTFTVGGDAVTGLAFDNDTVAVSYTHLRAHETVLDIVCRLLLAKKNTPPRKTTIHN